jgi:hypothetical protein
MSEIGDEHSKILKELLTPQRAAYKEQAEIGFDLAHAAKDAQVQKAATPQQSELLVEPKMGTLLQNMKRQK